MSIRFASDSNIISALFTASTVSHDAFTVTLRAYMEANDNDNYILGLDTRDSQGTFLYATGGATAWKVAHNWGSTVGSIGTGTTGEWISLAIVGTVNDSSQKVLRAYVRASGSTQAVEIVHGHQTSDYLTRIVLGGLYTGEAENADCYIADAKIWSRVLSQVEIEAEWGASAPVDSTNLICYAPFGGANIGEALASTTANQAGFATWSSDDFGGSASATDPTWSATNPAYSGGGPNPTLSGTVQMSSAVPTPGDIKQTAINSIINGTGLSVTLPSATPSGRILVAIVGGWMDAATDIAITDNLGSTWTKAALQKHDGQSIWLGVWTLVAPGDGSPMTITATPNAAGNWISLAVLEIAADPGGTIINAGPAMQSGADAIARVTMPTTTAQHSIVIGAVTWMESTNAAQSTEGWPIVALKNGQSGVAVVSRTFTSSAIYKPQIAMTIPNAWLMTGFAIAIDTTPSVPSGKTRRRHGLKLWSD